MRPLFARWRLAAASLAAAAAAVAGLTLSGPAQQALATTITQTGPFPVGNLLNYANSDIESTNFNWAKDLSQTNDVNSIGQGTTSFLHGHSLKIVASGTGTIIYKLGNGSDNTSVAIKLPKTGADYRVGAYFKVPTTGTHTVEFDLGCYDSSSNWLGWTLGTPVTLNNSGNWQYAEDDYLAGTSTALPSACAQVQGSPRVKVTGMTAAGDVVHMDEAIFAPYRAAIAIGARGSESKNEGGYSASDWLTTNNSIGPGLQSDKEFFGGGLPSTTVGGKTPFEQTNCYGIEQGLPAGQHYPACILAYKGSMTQTDMNNFLVSVPPGQQLYLVYWQEAEGSYPGTAQQFVSAFQANAQLVHGSPYDKPNIFVAQDSAGSYYESHQDCSWIVPASNTNGPDVYLMDHYENVTVNGNNVNNSVNATEWQEWLKCASAQNRPLGFGEYGLDDSYELNQNQPSPPCDNGQSTTNAQNLPKALVADNGYLEQLPMSGDPNLLNPAPFVVWDYWYSYYGGTSVCTLFGNYYHAIDKWQTIENQNGGQVGG